MSELRIPVLDKGFVELVDWIGSDNTIAKCARLSVGGKKKRTDDELLKFLIKNNHTSPFEQAEFQFLVKAPLFVARHWMRHRTWSYLEVSRRYSKAPIEFYYPALNRTTLEYKEVIRDSYNRSLQDYNFLIQQKVPRELARIVLPVGMYTTFYAKTDLHNLFHFLELRTSESAQHETALYAQKVECFVQRLFPISHLHWTNIRIHKVSEY